MSDSDENIDLANLRSVTMSKSQLWKGAGMLIAAVIAVAAMLPNLLPKAAIIATQEYVDDSVKKAEDEGMKVVEANTDAIAKNTEQVGAINVTLEGVVEGQQKARASAEADRVTQRIRNPDKRVKEYERVRQHAVRNLKAKPQREPLDGVDLEF